MARRPRNYEKPQTAKLRNPHERVRVDGMVTVDGGNEPWTVVAILPAHKTKLRLRREDDECEVEARRCDLWRGR